MTLYKYIMTISLPKFSKENGYLLLFLEGRSLIQIVCQVGMSILFCVIWKKKETSISSKTFPCTLTWENHNNHDVFKWNGFYFALPPKFWPYNIMIALQAKPLVAKIPKNNSFVSKFWPNPKQLGSNFQDCGYKPDHNVYVGLIVPVLVRIQFYMSCIFEIPSDG